MLRRFLVMFIIPAVVTVGPWLLFSAPKWWSRVTAAISGGSSNTAGPPTAPDNATAPTASGTPQALPAPQETPSSPDRIPLAELAEVLRFDVSPRWVMDRWPRVSAGLSQLQLQGYRVPLVTGTAEDDIAGSLTYYFNPRQQVQRITLQGSTGDGRKLVQLLVSRFGFARRLTNDPSSFVFEAPGPDEKVKSVLWLRPLRVVKAEDVHQRFQVSLVLERPEAPAS